MTERDEAAIFQRLIDKIDAPEVRLMLLDAVLRLSRLPNVSVSMYRHGYMASLRIERMDEWAFSLVPAKQWLLLYVRRPELLRGRIGFGELASVFDGVKKRADGELTVRLPDRSDIAKLCELIVSTA